MSNPTSSNPPRTTRERAEQHRSQASHTELYHSPWGKPQARLGDVHPPAQPPEEFVRDLSRAIGREAESNVSPFMRMLFAGKVPIEGVREFIKQLYFDARTFPALVAQMIANCSNHFDVRQCLATNLLEELGELNPGKEHGILLRRVGRALGLTDEEMEYVEPIPEVLLYVEYRQKLVRDVSFVEALAAGALSIELTIPGRYRKLAQTLHNRFGVAHEDLEFFYIHCGHPGLELDYGGDAAHAMQAADLLKKYATTAELQEKCRQAVWRSLEARKVYHAGLLREIVLKKDPRYLSLIHVETGGE